MTMIKSVFIILYTCSRIVTSSIHSTFPTFAPLFLNDSCPLPVTNGILPEQQGISSQVELWALFFPTHQLPIYAREEIKIAWHMTGTGPLYLYAAHPDGTRIKPLWGPERHEGSSWQRPGDEWGSGFIFPKRGCWKIIAQRGNSTAELPIRVIDDPNEF